MTHQKNYTILYTAIQTAFWMGFAVAVSFANLYLKTIGYSNTQLGIIMACGNIIAFVLSNTLGMLIDKFKKITVEKTISVLLILEGIALLLNFMTGKKCTAMSIVYPVYMGIYVSMASLNIKLGIDFNHIGKNVNYAIARAGGSLGFVFVSLILGLVAEKCGVRYIPIAGLILVFIKQLLNLIAIRELKNSGEEIPCPKSIGEESASSISLFIREHRIFFLMLIGIAFIFAGHNISANFLINVVKNLGGDSTDMGGINAWMAFVEILPMIFYRKIKENRKVAKLLLFAYLIWVSKAIAIALAPSLIWLYVAYTLQMFCFAIYTPAIVDYVSEVIPYKDSAKGQSMTMGMTTLGSLVASIVGGRLYDLYSVNTVLWIAALFTAVGSILCVVSIKKN